MSRRSRPPLIFSTTDCYGNLVTLSEDTWNTHVTIEHPEMAGLETVVQQTVEEPFEIRVSAFSDTGVAFVSTPGAGSHAEGIRVLVNYADVVYEKGSTSGKIQTAYPIDVIKYGRPQLGRVIYRKGGRK